MKSINLCLPLALFCAGFTVFSPVTAASTAEQSLLKDIKTTQQQLQQTDKQIRDERRALGKAIFQHTQDVQTLREQAAVAQRLLDEQNLSLSALEKRLQQWQEQTQYQQHLLSQFHRDAGNLATNDFMTQLQQLDQVASAMAASLTPAWQETQLVSREGEVSTANKLDLGPVQLYKLGEELGLASLDGKLWRADYAFTPTQSARWQNGDMAELTFDPTQTSALLQAEQSENLLQHLQKGGVWVVPIVLFALFALAIAIYKALQFVRLPSLPSMAGLSLLQTQPERWAALGAAGELLKVWQKFAPGQQRDDELFNVLIDGREQLERFVGAVAITASVAPLLGLLGTVSGMIDTFKMMTLFGAGDPQVVSGGISQALITTELGLVVAIPALIAHALLNRRAKQYYQQLEGLALSLSQQLSQQSSPQQNVEAA
ncbi:MotA/TolQ/ExbB proton channel family protein [Pseudoalteromonas fenneropenaei]|uniref:MotA/TolQ/ExbB proton channel family protein n=1 Tax=Pseudoalteromonas fenneropenaei TaxID=1737459 RepID=A0ABV7CGK8_9GAMM